MSHEALLLSVFCAASLLAIVRAHGNGCLYQKCEPGYEYKPCTEPGTWGSCEPCEDGKYQADFTDTNFRVLCKEVECDPDFGVLDCSESCSASRPPKCKCKKNFEGEYPWSCNCKPPYKEIDTECVDEQTPDAQTTATIRNGKTKSTIPSHKITGGSEGLPNDNQPTSPHPTESTEKCTGPVEELNQPFSWSGIGIGLCIGIFLAAGVWYLYQKIRGLSLNCDGFTSVRETDNYSGAETV